MFGKFIVAVSSLILLGSRTIHFKIIFLHIQKLGGRFKYRLAYKYSKHYLMNKSSDHNVLTGNRHGNTAL